MRPYFYSPLYRSLIFDFARWQWQVEPGENKSVVRSSCCSHSCKSPECGLSSSSGRSNRSTSLIEHPEVNPRQIGTRVEEQTYSLTSIGSFFLDSRLDTPVTKAINAIAESPVPQGNGGAEEEGPVALFEGYRPIGAIASRGQEYTLTGHAVQLGWRLTNMTFKGGSGV